ncbi:hypothetical protein V1525DRAFT_383543 [Lipomyces kononenkoae]|uniref:Uncharacterized protein n=1 Tax=Lipomyces kononenkoae TaxID=34357 RepID=A0ACC3SRU8_LIPKO
MALDQHHSPDLTATATATAPAPALVAMASRLGSQQLPATSASQRPALPGLSALVSTDTPAPVPDDSSNAPASSTSSIQLPSIAAINTIDRPQKSPQNQTAVRKSAKFIATPSAVGRPDEPPIQSPSSSSSFSIAPSQTASRLDPSTPPTFKPKPRRASAASAHQDESQHVVNFPAHPFDPATMLPPEHANQIPPGPFTIVRKRYATSVDDRHFLTVFEYMVNGQWIMWDYYSGYVHLTGLWKAIGNTKADIVKLVDNSPDLEPVIRRVRGGFLKIQGTWLPFTIARTLASRTCYHIRFALIPLFGPDFPDSCLKPDEPGFGQLQLTLTDSTRRRRKRTLHEGEDQPRRRRASKLAADEQHKWPTSPPSPHGAFAPNGLPTPLPSSSPSGPGAGPPAPLPMAYALPAVPRPGGRVHPAAVRQERSLSSPGHSSTVPLKLDFLQHSSLVSSRSEFLDALQATKSLQLLSAGASLPRSQARSRSDGAIVYNNKNAADRIPMYASSAAAQDTEDDVDKDEGREFECGGVLWWWDGKQELNVVGYSPQVSDVAHPIFNDMVLYDHTDGRQPRTLPGVSDVGGLLSFARVAEERESAERSQRKEDRDTPALSDGSASPEDTMIRTLSDSASPRMRMFGEPPSASSDGKKKGDVRKVMDISGLLS